MTYQKNYFRIAAVVLAALMPLLSSAQGDSCDEPIDLNMNYPIDGNGSYQIPVDNSQSSQFYIYTADKIGTLKMWSGFAYASGDPTFETDLKVYQTSCDNLIADIDSSPGLLGNCEYEVDVEIGDTYIFEWSNHNWAGEFNADYFFQEPVDAILCDNPRELTIGTNQHNSYFKTQYFEFTAPNSGILELSTCGFENAYGLYEFDLSNDCQNELSSNFDWDCDPDENYDWFTQKYTMVEGETITVATPDRLHSFYNFNATFPSQGEACQVPFDLTILPDDIYQVPHACLTCRINKWYKFIAPKTGPGIVSTGMASLAKHGFIGGQEQTYIKVYSDCDSEPIVENDDYYQFFGSSLVSIDFQEGETYYVEFVDEFINDSYYFDIFYEEDLLFGTEEDPLDVTLGLNEIHANMYYAGEQYEIGEQWFAYEFTSEGALTMEVTRNSDRQTIISVVSDNDYQFTYPDDDSGPDGFIMEGVAGDVVKFGLSRTNNTFSSSFQEDPCQGATPIEAEGTINVDNTLGDHWFEYTPTQNEFIIVATWGWSSEDTKISLYQDGCDTPIMSEDDNAGIQTIIQQKLEADVTYYIQFHDDKTSASYLAIVYFSPDEIPGLTCGDAINVDEGTHTVNNLFGDQWFTYTFQTDGEVTVSSCDTTTEDTLLDLQLGCDTYIDSSDDDCDFQSTLTYSGSLGEEITILWGADYEPEDLFDFNLSFIADCIVDDVSATQTVCDSFEFNGVTLYASGEYDGVFMNESGCDSLVALTLTILESDMVAETQAACGSYDFAGTSITTSGEYSATFLNKVGCDSLVTLDLTIFDEPSPGVSLNGAVLSADQEGDVTYHWFNCDSKSEIEGETSRELTPTTSGQYFVEIINKNCSTTSDCFTVVIPLSVRAKNVLTVSPNPTNSEFTIDFGAKRSEIIIEVIDATGRVVQKKYNTKMKSVDLQLNGDPGLYFIKTIVDGRQELIRIVKH